MSSPLSEFREEEAGSVFLPSSFLDVATGMSTIGASSPSSVTPPAAISALINLDFCSPSVSTPTASAIARSSAIDLV
jgi:hypothetical protein